MTTSKRKKTKDTSKPRTTINTTPMHESQLGFLLQARQTLLKPHAVKLATAVELDLAFLPCGLRIAPMQLAGQLRYTDAVDWMARFAGYVLLDDWKGLGLNTRAHYLGGAFCFGIHGAIVQAGTNPYIGNEEFMKQLHRGKVDLAECERLEKKFVKNGQINPLGEKEAERLRAEWRQHKEHYES